MAKVAFTKLGLNKDTSIDVLEWNEQNIEVKNYLPMSEKLELVSNIINNSIDDNGYYNPMRVHIHLIIETILAYTNINVTEKQREDVLKLYDLFVSTGLSGKIMSTINPYEYNYIKQWVNETIHSIYEYKNSVMGILDTISQDYSDLNLDVEHVQKQLSNKENFTLVRDVLTKLG